MFPKEKLPKTNVQDDLIHRTLQPYAGLMVEKLRNCICTGKCQTPQELI